ncbi:hypothetical protein [Streptomyces sp. NBC_00056]|uniref:hypothetical protein n=2 Tax=unclassified Streptomyces TaxID=2593676 RepID=UPI003D8071C6|nr:hypothetical protein [Streptomyces sp. NBC_00063]
MSRNAKKPRRLVANGRVYMWTMRHSHRADDDGRSVDCRQTLTLSPQPVGTGGPLRIVFAGGPGRFVPGGAALGSGDVGFTRGKSLNLHEPGAVRALLEVALSRGWQPGERRVVQVDGWTLLKEAGERAGDDARVVGQ